MIQSLSVKLCSTLQFNKNIIKLQGTRNSTGDEFDMNYVALDLYNVPDFNIPLITSVTSIPCLNVQSV